MTQAGILLTITPIISCIRSIISASNHNETKLWNKQRPENYTKRYEEETNEKNAVPTKQYSTILIIHNIIYYYSNIILLKSSYDL